jgi:prefoldin subunit 5
MRDQLEKRLAELKSEFEAGQRQLETLEQQAAGLRQTLLRISGAAQVLEEVLAAESGGDGASSPGVVQTSTDAS